MQLTIASIDGPAGLAAQAPLVVDLLREMPGPDRPDYWLAALQTPISVIIDNHDRGITHLVLAARWQGTSISSGVKQLPLGVAYVIDQSLLSDARLDFSKCSYVAIAIGSDTSGGQPDTPLHNVIAGHIAKAFGCGKTFT